MKIWYPQTLDKSKCKGIPSYLLKCQADLFLLRLCLRHNINNLRWNDLNNRLKNCKSINFVKDIKAITIANQFISCLQCSYDNSSCKCYYYVPENIKCIGTTNTLNYVIRLIEFGNDEIPTMNWIRHSYIEFKNKVAEGVQQ